MRVLKIGDIFGDQDFIQSSSELNEFSPCPTERNPVEMLVFEFRRDLTVLISGCPVALHCTSRGTERMGIVSEYDNRS